MGKVVRSTICAALVPFHAVGRILMLDVVRDGKWAKSIRHFMQLPSFKHLESPHCFKQ
jgi:hypothetical protein